MTRPGILTRISKRLEARRRAARFAASLRHLHGPRKLETGPHDVVLIALVRNGSYYLDAFFEYYRSLGIRHFVFFDNGSTDDTIERIKAEDDTIIDQSDLPLAEFEGLIRGYPAKTYGAGRWCLYVDMDEVFDFEGREEIGIAGLVDYLEGQGATAFVAQMLEMFPNAPLSAVEDIPFAEALAQFRYYDTGSVKRFGYHSHEIEFWQLLTDNTLIDDRVQFCFGGVRGKVFGENCCLTKHPLIFNGPGVEPGVHPHLSVGVRVADVTGVIKHYKFTNNPRRRDAASQQVRDVAHGEDAARLRVLEGQPDVSLWSGDAREWRGIAPLYEEDFLLRSDRLSAYIAERRG